MEDFTNEITREDVIKHLENGECGDWAWNDETGREVHVVEMCGGRYMMLKSRESYSIRLTDDVEEAVRFMEVNEDDDE